jgi:hypothetical protein
LGEAWLIARNTGQSERQALLAREMISWSLAEPAGNREPSQRLWNLAAARLLGEALPHDAESITCWRKSDALLLGVPLERRSVSGGPADHLQYVRGFRWKGKTPELIIDGDDIEVKPVPRLPPESPLLIPSANGGFCLSPESRMALTWDASGGQLWEGDPPYKTGRLLKQKWIQGATFSSDRRLVLTWQAVAPNPSQATEAKLWEVSACNSQGLPLSHPCPITHALFYHAGDAVGVVTVHEGGVRWWPLSHTLLTPAECVEAVQLWIHISSGMELEESGEVRESSIETLRLRRERFQVLIGQIDR